MTWEDLAANVILRIFDRVIDRLDEQAEPTPGERQTRRDKLSGVWDRLADKVAGKLAANVAKRIQEQQEGKVQT